MENRICVICKNIYKPRMQKQETCGDKSCVDKNNYNKNKEKYKENARRWDRLNPEKAKQKRKEALEKFRREKPERFNELMRNQYHKHKDKWKSRNNTYNILNGRGGFRKFNPLKKECACGSTENLEIHHEVYPTLVKDIKKAILDGKIYYKCRDCHSRRNSHDIKEITKPKSI